ncbi:MAG: hypothetical protein AAF242_15165 [Bacteroidota bacterium]
MEILANIELYPVVRFSPSDFEEVNYPFKTRVSENELYQYWKSILQKQGFPNLEPIKKGYHYVRACEIDDISLETLIKHRLIDIAEYRCEVIEESQKSTVELEAGITPTSLEGGVVFTANDKIIMTPQCCVSLQDHQEWTRIKPNNSFTRIWLGHPWIYYKTEGNSILFTRLIEKSFDGKTWKHYETKDNTMLLDASKVTQKTAKAIDENDLKYIVDYSEMEEALANLQITLDHFQLRIEQIATQNGWINPTKLAHCFVNGNGEMLSYDQSDAE